MAAKNQYQLNKEIEAFIRAKAELHFKKRANYQYSSHVVYILNYMWSLYNI